MKIFANGVSILLELSILEWYIIVIVKRYVFLLLLNAWKQ